MENERLGESSDTMNESVKDTLSTTAGQATLAPTGDQLLTPSEVLGVHPDMDQRSVGSGD